MSEVDTGAEGVERVAVIEQAIPQPWRRFIVSLTAERDALKQQLSTQSYTYIGKDGRAVLARDLEDERDALRAQLSQARDEAMEGAKVVCETIEMLLVEKEDHCGIVAARLCAAGIDALKSHTPTEEE